MPFFPGACVGEMLLQGRVKHLLNLSEPILRTGAVVLASSELLEECGGLHVRS